MSGFQFSMPEPRPRDGWFRIGSLDITTSALVALVGLASMFVYAFSPDLVFEGAFSTELVRDGEVWRLATWPLVNPPSIWELIGLAVFWLLGNLVEEEMGRKPFAVLLVAMTVIPAAIVTLIGANNELLDSRWSATTFSVSLLTLGIITIFGIQHPEAKFFFGIPAWVIAAAFVGIQVLSSLGNRAYAQLILVLLVVAVGCIGARQRGMLDSLSFIPRIGALSGPPPSPYGELGSARPTSRPKRRRGLGLGRNRGRSDSPSVVSGPWGQPSGPTPIEQAELDVLLDRISENGIDSLTKQEKQRLTELSRRMRD